MDTNKLFTSIYLDLSKAFDTLSFDTLLTKFEYYRSSSVPLDLPTTYIKDRYQKRTLERENIKFVRNWNRYSTGIDIQLLGLLFFTIYINDIIKASVIFNYIMYADYTTLYCNL